jgi:hypothetical protein
MRFAFDQDEIGQILVKHILGEETYLKTKSKVRLELRLTGSNNFDVLAEITDIKKIDNQKAEVEHD